MAAGGGGKHRHNNQQQQRQRRRRGRNHHKLNDDDKNSSHHASTTTNTALLIPPLSEDAPVWYQLEKDAPFRHATIVTHPPPPEKKPVGKNKKNSSREQQQQQQQPPGNTPQMIQRYRSQADDIYQKEMENFNRKQRNSDAGESDGDRQWLQSTISKGTLKDRIAAMSVLVSSDPVHKLHTALDGLLQMTGCCCSTSSSTPQGNHAPQSQSQSQPNNSRVAQLAAEALVDLFLHTLIPTDRKLISLAHRPLYLFEKQQHDDNNSSSQTQTTLSPRILLLWRLEELVETKYRQFLRQYMAATLRGGDKHAAVVVEPAQKQATLYMASTLLQNIPTAEDVVLQQLLVNKLGDPHKRVAATAGHCLRLVLQQHEAMQTVVAREVQQLAHRPHLHDRALYNCIIFLNQLSLSDKDPVLPASLVSTYFRLFEVAIIQKGKDDGGKSSKKRKKKSGHNSSSSEVSSSSSAVKSRLLSALLTGVNRAHPFLPDADEQMEQHVHALYRVVYDKAPPAACTQALLLLFHWAVGSKITITTSNDTDESYHNNNDNGRRSRREHKKKLQAAEASAAKNERNKEPHQLTDQERSRQDEFYKVLYSRLSAKAGILTSGGGKHLTLFFNLLYKAMKYDTDSNRVLAYAKRLVSTTLHGPSTVLAASIYLLNEIGRNFHPILLTCFQTVLPTELARSRMLNAREQDPRKAICTLEQAEATNSRRQQKPKTNSSIPVTEDDDTNQQGKKALITAPSWELSLNMNHYHPSVASFATNMGSIEYSGDPLRDFGLAPFLDKFAYRNPKQIASKKVEEQVAAADGGKIQQQQQRVKSIAERRNKNDATSTYAAPLNDPSFLEKQNISVQDEFFHRFFVEQARRDQVKGIVRYKTASSTAAKRDDEDGADSVDNEEARLQEQEAAEEKALDAAEALNMDHAYQQFDDDDSFAQYEAQWETDEEEEAFVDQLAQDIIEDAATANGEELGPDELDEEDPDMDGWGDLDDDDGEDDDEAAEQFEAAEEAEMAGQGDDVVDDDDDDDDEDEDGDEIDWDAMEDDEGDDDDDDDDDSGFQFHHDNPQDGVSFNRFFDGENVDNNDDDDNDSSDDDDDDDLQHLLREESDSDESGDEETEEQDSSHKRKKARA